MNVAIKKCLASLFYEIGITLNYDTNWGEKVTGILLFVTTSLIGVIKWDILPSWTMSEQPSRTLHINYTYLFCNHVTWADCQQWGIYCFVDIVIVSTKTVMSVLMGQPESSDPSSTVISPSWPKLASWACATHTVHIVGIFQFISQLLSEDQSGLDLD